MTLVGLLVVVALDVTRFTDLTFTHKRFTLKDLSVSPQIISFLKSSGISFLGRGVTKGYRTEHEEGVKNLHFIRQKWETCFPMLQNI